MCGRYSLAVDPAQVAARFRLTEAVEFQPEVNIAPGTDILAVATNREGRRTARQLRWGLVPHWAEDPSIGNRMINARAEGIAEKPAFRRPFERHRCLIPADGFYEWQAREGLPKQVFRISKSDGQLLGLAGLWSVWHRGEPDELRTCTIITTAANARMAEIHDRMPVVVAPEDEELWLDRDTPVAQLRALLHSLAPEQTQLTPVTLPPLPPSRPAEPPQQGTLFA